MSTQRSPSPTMQESVPMQSSLSIHNLENAIHGSYGSDTQIDFSSSQYEDAEGLRNITKRLKRKFNHAVDSRASNAEIKAMFEGFQKDQNLKLDQLNSAIFTLQERTDEIRNNLQFVSDKYDAFLERMSGIEQENYKNTKTLAYLESKIELLERNSRAASIEINNVPKDRNENKETLRSIAKDIGKVIGQPINDTDVYDVYRIKSKMERKSPIIVQFTTTFLKNNLIKKCRMFNKENNNNKLNTSHIHLATSSQSQPIYIDEFLTPTAKRLRYLVKKFKGENNYHSFWNSYGKIYIKEKESSRPIRIDNEEDLLKLKSK